MKNFAIRELIKKNRLLHYEIAEEIGISESTLSIWLRKDLSNDRKKKVLDAIDNLISA